MTTATGEVAINFAPLEDVNPYTSASLTYFGTARHQIISATLKAALAGDFVIHRYNGSMGTGEIRSKIEVGANPGSGDALMAQIMDASGNGYAMWINGTSVALRRYAAGEFADALGSTTITHTSGDVYELRYDPTTDTLSCWQNGVATGLSAVDSTVTAGLAPAFGADWQNSNAGAILSWAADGVAAVAASSNKMLLLGVG